MKALNPDLGRFTEIGWAALVAGCLVTIALSWNEGRLEDGLATTSVALVASFAVAVATSVMLGRVVLIYIHLAAAALVAVGVLSTFFDYPLLPSLANLATGLLVVVAVGRVGCFRTGCCRGIEAQRGVRYVEIGTGGRPFQTSGPHLPVQLLEAAATAILLTLILAMHWLGTEPATKLATAIGGYGSIRLWAELFRAPHGVELPGGIGHATATAFAVTLAGAVVATSTLHSLGLLAIGIGGLWAHHSTGRTLARDSIGDYL